MHAKALRWIMYAAGSQTTTCSYYLLLIQDVTTLGGACKLFCYYEYSSFGLF